ncbi:hypothetical protein Ndes2526B_g07661 [Nannochloris sp. 'desiccata']
MLQSGEVLNEVLVVTSFHADAALTKLPSLCVHNWVQRYTAALYLQGRQLPTGASMLALVNLFPSLNPFIKAFF